MPCPCATFFLQKDSKSELNAYKRAAAEGGFR